MSRCSAAGTRSFSRVRRLGRVVGFVVGAGVALLPAFRPSEASAAITQPPQPKAGPGGRNYHHGDWRVSSGGTGSDAWFVFEPVDPQPASAPLAIIMHGYFEFSGYDQMYELIRHTVRKGNIVIYPRWQTDIVTPCAGPFDIEPCITSALNGIRGALSYLQPMPHASSRSSAGRATSGSRSGASSPRTSRTGTPRWACLLRG